MSAFTLKPDERLILEIPGALAFRERASDGFPVRFGSGIAR
jgi:hypothetical protein